MIFLGIGANLPSERHGPPLLTLEAALKSLAERNLAILRRSSWWESAPVPVSEQPWFVNGVIEVGTNMTPQALLDCLHDVERELGRVRGERWAARVIDLDLIAYRGSVLGWRGESSRATGLVVPHPRMHQRAFVLRPLVELQADWRHPVFGRTADELLDALPPGQAIRQRIDS